MDVVRITVFTGVHESIPTSIVTISDNRISWSVKLALSASALDNVLPFVPNLYYASLSLSVSPHFSLSILLTV